MNGRRRGDTTTTGDGPRGITPSNRDEPPLRTGRKALEGRMASRENPFAEGGNAVNPRVGSRAQQTCTIAEEEAVGVVRNHEDGTRLELAAPVRR